VTCADALGHLSKDELGREVNVTAASFVNADKPSMTVRARDGGGAQGANALSLKRWPWDRPATTVYADDRLAAPGHHLGSFLSRPSTSGRGQYGAQSFMPVKLSERAATILQGFPETWRWLSKTKSGRWSMIGQAMPPPLAEAVARAIKEVM
jgi:site-specific DNA-cytosine methylase